MNITRTLRQGARGTARLREKHGDALVCVRYRVDEENARRYKTVELIVEEMRFVPSRRWRWLHQEVLVTVRFEEVKLRSQVKTAGGIWDREARSWRLARYVALQLGLRKRITTTVSQRVHG